MANGMVLDQTILAAQRRRQVPADPLRIRGGGSSFQMAQRPTTRGPTGYVVEAVPRQGPRNPLINTLGEDTRTEFCRATIHKERG